MHTGGVTQADALRELQRKRIIDAFCDVVAERGAARVSVSVVAARAGVSKRTLRSQVGDVEDCFGAILDLGLDRTREIITSAFAAHPSWEEAIRAALVELLEYLDAEPGLTRIWFVDALSAGSAVREHRTRNIALLRDLIAREWTKQAGPSPDLVVVGGLIESLFGTIHAHLVTARPEPLVTLLGPLGALALIATADPDRTVAEIGHGSRLASQLLARRETQPSRRAPSLPALLRDPRAHRARACIAYLGVHPGASNREIGVAIGVPSRTQVSTLLARLAKLGLAQKRCQGPGHANHWALTVKGEAFMRATPTGETRTPTVGPSDRASVSGHPTSREASHILTSDADTM